jgi:hypothetical protein
MATPLTRARARRKDAKPERVAPTPEAAATAAVRPSMSSVEFLAGELLALETAEAAAFADGSWQAYATLKRQKREIFDALAQAREAEQRATKGPTLTDEQILHQHLIPSIAKLPLPAAWEVYQALGLRLGQGSARADDDAEAS